MRRAVTFALVASLACLGAEPAEAISFTVPIQVVTDAGVRWSSDGGTCLTPAGWDKVDNSFKDLQTKADKPSNPEWFLAGLGSGAGAAAVIGVILFFALKK